MELRLGYIGTRAEIFANVERISARSGVPKRHLLNLARKRGWGRQSNRRPWTLQEQEYLRQTVGKVSVERIAHNLHRGILSVHCRISRLKLSRRLTVGYNVSDLVELFGLCRTRVDSWVNCGLLGEPQGHGGHGGNIRFDEAAVVRFICEHSREYDLARVDQEWFKRLVFGEGRDR